MRMFYLYIFKGFKSNYRIRQILVPWIFISVLLVGCNEKSSDKADGGSNHSPDIFGSAPNVIAFNSDRDKYFMNDGGANTEIYIMDGDGTNLCNLTQNKVLDSSPHWSPDGNFIVFFRNPSSSFYPSTIHRMNRDGSQETELASGDGQFALSPDGSTIAFRYDGQIYRINVDGSNKTQLTDGRYPLKDDITWSPDGTRIAFSQEPDGEIYVMNADGSDLRNITNHPALDNHPSWSPDGTKIAFVSGRDGFEQIYVMNSDGTDQIRLTDDDEYDEWPSWSPDGKYIAFVSNRDGNLEIYRMDADGGNPLNLSESVGGDNDPNWSLDGSQIAFHSHRDGNWEIYVVDVDGTNLRNLTNSPESDDTSPRFGPWDANEGGQRTCPNLSPESPF